MQTYPVIAAVATGLAFMTFKLTHHAIYNPDVKFDKTARMSPFDRSEAEGEVWAQNAKSHSRWNRPGLDVGAVSVFEAWFKPEKKEGTAKVFGPTPPASA